MRHASLLLRASISVFLAQAASAQPMPKGITAQFADPHVVDAFAQCVVAKHPSDAATYVLGNVTDRRTAPRFSVPRSLKDKTCIPSQASREDARLLPELSEDAVKAALADALVRREFPSFDGRVIKMAKPLPSGTLVDTLFPPDACNKCDARRKAEFEDARLKLNNVMAPIIFGECAVRTDPANAHALIISEPSSAEETAYISALAAAFDNCLTKGAQFTASRSVLRGLIAISYYRIAHAPRVDLAGAPK